MSETVQKPAFYGAVAEFLSAQDLLDAIYQTKDAGYTEIDAFTPFPVEEISEEICNHKKSNVSKIVGTMAILGTLTAFSLQYYVSVIAYPLNIGGRPLFSWPAWIPVMFELTILFASFGAIGGMLFLNGLPRPYHPLFNLERFERASIDRHFLLIQSTDSQYDAAETRAFLQGLDPEEVMDVDW